MDQFLHGGAELVAVKAPGAICVQHLRKKERERERKRERKREREKEREKEREGGCARERERETEILQNLQDRSNRVT